MYFVDDFNWIDCTRMSSSVESKNLSGVCERSSLEIQFLFSAKGKLVSRSMNKLNVNGADDIATCPSAA